MPEFPSDRSFEPEEFYPELCDHIALVSLGENEIQCMDCLRKWPKRPGFVSDFPEYDSG